MEQMNEPNPPTLEQPTEFIEPETERPQEGVKQLCVNALKKVIPGIRGEHEVADAEAPPLNRPLTRRETHRQSVREFKQAKNHSKVAAQYHHRRNLRSTHGRSPENKDPHPGRTERAESRYQIMVDNLSDADDIGRFEPYEQQYASQKVETSARDWLKKAQAAAEADNKAKNDAGIDRSFDNFTYFADILDYVDEDDATKNLDFRRKLIYAASLVDSKKLSAELSGLKSIKNGASMTSESFKTILEATSDEQSYRSLLRRAAGLEARYDNVESPSGKEKLTREERDFGEELAVAKEARGEAFMRGFLHEAGLDQTVAELSIIDSQYPDMSFQLRLANAINNTGRKNVIEKLNESQAITPHYEWGMGNLGPNKYDKKSVGDVIEKFLDARQEDTSRMLRKLELEDIRQENQPVNALIASYMHYNYKEGSRLRHPEIYDSEIDLMPLSPYERRARHKTNKQYKKSERVHAKLVAKHEKISLAPTARKPSKQNKTPLKQRATEFSRDRLDQTQQFKRRQTRNFKNRPKDANARFNYAIDESKPKLLRGAAAIHPGNIEARNIYQQAKIVRARRKQNKPNKT